MPRRRLTPETIIPEDLYVERQADRDLDRIVDEMGRPGYVLVARQMGKTNLLLHMKRRREVAGDLVVYLDLSNRFETLRELFRWIIDGLIEYSNGQLDSVHSTIAEQRTSTDVAPHIEYDRHLRLLLKEIPQRRIVIILDEVDSLSTVPFSDAFWAQIRSMYFARANYSEYKRLTYALSGVAEPSDLIKDKAISPFNIGEKVYLEDFDKSELTSLTQKAELPFDQETIDNLYEWTGGNPRMTWDVCAALESMIADGVAVGPHDVDAVIDRLYLRAFDRAPIDHVRDLVQGDQTLRDAIVTVRFGKGDTLDARTRSRLYLAGVTRAAELSPAIKNKVIDLALSDAWLAQASRDRKSLVERAYEAYETKRFSDAISLFETWRQQNSYEDLKAEYRVVLGASHYALDNNEAAAAELATAIPDIDSLSTSHWAKYILASALLKLRQIDACLPIFEELGSNGSEYQYSARQNLAAALASTAPAENADKIIRISTELIEELSSTKKHIDQRDSLIAASHFSIAQALIGTDDYQRASAHLLEAERAAPIDFRPEVMLARIRLETDAHVRAELAKKLAETIIDSPLLLPEANGGQTRFTHSTLALVIVRLIQTSTDRSQSSELIAGLLKKLMPDRTPFEGLLDLFRRAADLEKSAFVPLLTFALREFSYAVLRDFDSLEAHRLVAKFSPDKERLGAARAYRTVFQQLMRPEWFGFDDVLVFLDLAVGLHSAQEYTEELQTLSLLDPYWDQLKEQGRLAVLLVLNYKLYGHQAKRDAKGAKLIARQMIEIDESDEFEDDLSTELASSRRQIVDQARRYVAAFTPDPYRHFGRNEWIVIRKSEVDAEEAVKFKHVEADLRSGKLVFVRRGRDRGQN